MAINIKIKPETERYFFLKYYQGVQYGLDSPQWADLCFGKEIEVDSMPDGLEDKVDIIT